MRYPEIKALDDRLYFSHEDIAHLLGIKYPSAIVLCSRYVNRGIFIRFKKDFYTLQDRWRKNSKEDFFRISNIVQVPSYLSLMTALSFYEVTTQVQREFFESVCIKRTARFEIENIKFNFYKLKKELYFDFYKKQEFFIATPEKAFLDAVYLYSFAKYALDMDSIDIGKLDIQRIKKLLKRFPDKTKRLVEIICKI